jgi:hypothetical protein
MAHCTTCNFARLRTKVTKGPGSRDAGIAMGYKIIDAAQARWRAVNAPTWSPWSAPARPSTRFASTTADVSPLGQTVLASGYDTRFTNDGTGHGML